MKKKRVLPLLVIGVMNVCLLFGCSNNQELSKEGESKQESTVWTENVMSKDFLGDIEKKKVLSITFVDTLEAEPEDSWDVSVAQDGSVKAWTEEESIFYHVFIGAEGGMCIETGAELFAGIPNLGSITFNDCFHTDNVTNMSEMFSGCSLLESLDLSGFCTENVTDTNHMFYKCENLKTLDISSFDTSNVTDMNSMFHHCRNLEMVDVSNFDTSKVTNMSSMFAGCGNFEELNLSNFDTKNVTDMYGMFKGNGSKRIDVSSFDTSNVTIMNGMFLGCEQLEFVDVSGFSTENVIDFGLMFGTCINLKELNVSGFVIQEEVYIWSMLYQVPEEVVICQPGQLPDGVWFN